MKVKNILLISYLIIGFIAFANHKNSDQKKFKKYTKTNTQVSLKKKQKKQIINFAESFLGTKYKFAGLSRNGIDCSGLIYLCFQNIGIKLPKLADAIAYEGKAVWKVKDLKMGDLVFFENTYKTKNMITHVGIYVEDGKFIHASSSLGVGYSNLETNTYWKGKFAFGKRL